jgi:uncharacterized protein with PIN domain
LHCRKLNEAADFAVNVRTDILTVFNRQNPVATARSEGPGNPNLNFGEINAYAQAHAHAQTLLERGVAIAQDRAMNDMRRNDETS